ncbi:MAG: FAD-binding oxidoreductase [Alphaproteobacteria bacterium]|nr:FAD-binding oxidoreductase [Alphaproteobacteria bacterium]
MIEPGAISRLKDIVGDGGYSDDPKEIAPHLREWRGRYHGRSPLLVKPKSTDELAKVLAVCDETRTPLVPQGGNTGLVGGQIPFHGEIVLSLARLNAIRQVDTETMSVTAEAGAILADIQHAADRAGAYFPLSLASEGSCTIGGNLSTNAGGVNVLHYGNAREQVLGLEVVLANGTVLDMLRSLRKDNTGYDLKHLFIGAEGTLGIITAAVLKLQPKPEQHVTAFCAIPDPAAAVTLLHRLNRATGGLITAFEIMPRIGLEFVLRHMENVRDPFAAAHSWYVLVEAQGGAIVPLRECLEAALVAASEDSFLDDAVFADSEGQRAALWRLREDMSEAQKFEGGSIKHDISVPLARIPAFLERAQTRIQALVPGIRPVPFGHIGDGNLHFNLSVPVGADNAAFLARWEEISRVVHDVVADFNGSISAEHGLGIMKAKEIARYKSAAELGTMALIKRSLDPNNILNPGKVLDL